MNTTQTITSLYRDYESGDLAKVLNGLPDDFRFEWPFDPDTARFSGICRNKTELVAQLNEMAASFQFNRYHAVNILVDGDRAAVQVEVDLTSKKTGRRFSTTIAHFWWFEDGIPVRLVEYVDTALTASESYGKSDTATDSASAKG